MNIILINIILGICISFVGFYFANKMTGFGATPTFLAIVAVIGVPLRLIPEYGWIISLITVFLLLRSISKNGLILMMFASWVMMTLILTGLKQVL